MSNKEALQDLMTKYTEKQPANSVTALTGQIVALVEYQAAEIKKLRDEAFEPYDTEQILAKLGVKVEMNSHPLAVIGLTQTLMKAQAEDIKALKNTIANIQPLSTMLESLGIPMKNQDPDYTLGVALSHLKAQDDQIKGLQSSQTIVPNFSHLMDALLLAMPDQNPLIDYSAATLVNMAANTIENQHKRLSTLALAGTVPAPHIHELALALNLVPISQPYPHSHSHEHANLTELIEMATKLIKHQHKQVQTLTGQIEAQIPVQKSEATDSSYGWIDLPLLTETLAALGCPVPKNSTSHHVVITAIEVLRAQHFDLEHLKKKAAPSNTKAIQGVDPKDYSVDKIMHDLNYVNVSGHDLDVVCAAMDSLKAQQGIIAEYQQKFKTPVTVTSVKDQLDTQTLLWLSLMVRGEMQIDQQVMMQLPTPERRELIAWKDEHALKYHVQARVLPPAKKPELPF